MNRTDIRPMRLLDNWESIESGGKDCVDITDRSKPWQQLFWKWSGLGRTDLPHCSGSPTRIVIVSGDKKYAFDFIEDGAKQKNIFQSLSKIMNDYELLHEIKLGEACMLVIKYKIELDCVVYWYGVKDDDIFIWRDFACYPGMLTTDKLLAEAEDRFHRWEIDLSVNLHQAKQRILLTLAKTETI